MKALMTLVGLLVLLVIGLQIVYSPQASALQVRDKHNLRIATYNVHYIDLNKGAGSWSVADWERRKLPLDNAFKALKADVVAFQEMESFRRGSDGGINLTLDWLLARNEDYSAAAIGNWREFPSTQPILFRHDRLALLDQGWFFFSDTPEIIYSRTYNGSYPAFASWAQFRDRGDGKEFYVFNVHYEYKSQSNRQLSAQLTASRIEPLTEGGSHVILAGDLNAWLGSTTVDTLARSGLSFLPVNGATYHLNWGLNLFAAIDHLAMSRGVLPLGTPVVLSQQFNDEWPTDHYPVVGDFHLP